MTPDQEVHASNGKDQKYGEVQNGKVKEELGQEQALNVPRQLDLVPTE